MEQETIIIVSCFSAAWLMLLVLIISLFMKVGTLRKLVNEMQATGRLRVQKLKMNPDKNHAFNNPGLVPDEELSRRGYTMYSPDDVETGSKIHERQTGGQFVEELSREIDQRQQRLRKQDSFARDIRGQDSSGRSQDLFGRDQDSLTRDNRSHDSSLHRSQASLGRTQDSAPPFLLQSIEENKRITRSLMNPNANQNHGRPSDTNPNFIY